MSLFTKLHDRTANQKQEPIDNRTTPSVEIDRHLSATEGMIGGCQTILAGSDNFFGLTFDPACRAAARAAVKHEGTGTGLPYGAHTALEHELAAFFGCRGAIVFASGHIACLTILSTLAGPGDVILADAQLHESVKDSCRMSGAQLRSFRHNDHIDLDQQLRQLGSRVTNTLILVAGIYRKYGDRAPLAEISRVKRRHGAILLVDETYALGVLGATGRGRTQETAVENDVDFILGTCDKTLGADGGFCVSRRPELELLRSALRSRSFIAPPSPAAVAAARQALVILAQRPVLRGQLWANARQLYSGLRGLGFLLGPVLSPIINIIIDDHKQALTLWQHLLEHGIYVELLAPPRTKRSTRLRCSVSAAHTTEQIDAIIAGFGSAADRLHLQHAA